MGEADKHDRYNGRARPLVFESLGRLGTESQRTLQAITRAAASAGHTGPGSQLKWRAAMERTLIASVADSRLRALGMQAATSCGAALDKAATKRMQTQAHGAASQHTKQPKR